MTDLVLSESEQAAVRAVIAVESSPGDLLAAEIQQRLCRLIPCDAAGIALLDSGGWAVGEAVGWPDLPGNDGFASHDGVGIQLRHGSSRHGVHETHEVAVLSLGVRHGRFVVTLWLVRRHLDFGSHDRALLQLVAPSIERVLRARPTWSLPPLLTVQERRVLHHVADGLSNAEVAQRLCVAPCTVRKHLEHAYRKLGVSSRLAAVHALEVGRTVAPDGGHSSTASGRTLVPT